MAIDHGSGSLTCPTSTWCSEAAAKGAAAASHKGASSLFCAAAPSPSPATAPDSTIGRATAICASSSPFAGSGPESTMATAIGAAHTIVDASVDKTSSRRGCGRCCAVECNYGGKPDMVCVSRSPHLRSRRRLRSAGRSRSRSTTSACPSRSDSAGQCPRRSAPSLAAPRCRPRRHRASLR